MVRRWQCNSLTITLSPLFSFFGLSGRWNKWEGKSKCTCWNVWKFVYIVQLSLLIDSLWIENVCLTYSKKRHIGKKKFIIEITSCVSTTHTWDSVLSTDDSFWKWKRSNLLIVWLSEMKRVKIVDSYFAWQGPKCFKKNWIWFEQFLCPCHRCMWCVWDLAVDFLMVKSSLIFHSHKYALSSHEQFMSL